VTWAAIFEKNSTYLSEALGVYIQKMTDFKKLVDNVDVKGIHSSIVEANEINRVLKGIELNKTS